MKLARAWLTVCLACWLGWCSLAWADTTIVVIRHGEKPEAGLGQLNCQGLNRALALPTVLLNRYGVPHRLHAPNPTVLKVDKGQSYPYVRPLATIEPLAVRLGLPVNIQWGMTEVAALGTDLLSQPDGLQVVAWEHHLAVVLTRQLLTQLGGDPAEVPAWANDDYDSFYVIRAQRDGDGHWHNAQFLHEQQSLNGLPNTCPQP